MSMSLKNRVILYAVVLGVLLYILDAVIYYFIFSENHTFYQVLITAVPVNEIYSRMLMFTGVVVFGFIISGLISDLNFENEIALQKSGASENDKPDSSFINNLSYQIRTPLNAIVGFSELLKDPNLSMHSKQTYANHIHLSGNYLLQLINNISDISKLESNSMKINKEEFELNEVFDELKKYFNEQKKEMGKADVGLSLKKKVKDSHFRIVTDKKRFKQVLLNLLENAFKHTDEGMVEFGYDIKDKNMLEVFVKDTGQGFSMERLEIIFNRYKKLSDNQNQPFDGSALLLTISKSLVKLLGGDIWADSRIGKGSNFYFNFPFQVIEKDDTSEKPEIKPRIKGSSPNERDWSGHTILIAEDVESNYIYIKELLKPTKVELLWAENGKIALDLVKSNKKIELVLMDILMPEMDGYESAMEIKQLHPDLPIVAQTAYSMEDSGEKGEMIKNFNDILIKPIWSPQLLSVIDKYIS